MQLVQIIESSAKSTSDPGWYLIPDSLESWTELSKWLRDHDHWPALIKIVYPRLIILQFFKKSFITKGVTISFFATPV